MKPYLSLLLAFPLAAAFAQDAPQRPPDGPRTVQRGPGAGPGGGPGFGMGGVRPERELVKEFDKDNNGRLNAAERQAALELVQKEIAEGRGPRRFGPRGGESQG